LSLYPAGINPIPELRIPFCSVAGTPLSVIEGDPEGTSTCSMKRIRILLIEDNRLFRDGLTAMINGQPDMRVVAASGGHENTLQKARTVKPRVILIDLGLRNQNGVHIVKSVSTAWPEMKVIGMGLIPTQLDVVEFVQAGASGFILKDAKIDDFLGTIRAVAHGGKVIPSPLTGSLFSHVIELALKKRKGPPKNAVRMTKRELEIIALIADGLSNKDIALRLNIATYTVKSHVHNVLEKLALHSRLEIARYTRDDVPS
jgi:DNA-binding NarL/FixJ family response regulator